MYTIHVGFSGFPIGMASVRRTLLTFKGLKEAGRQPLIINKISHHQYSDHVKVKRFEGIPFVNTAYANAKPASFIKRNLNKLSGYFGEIILLYKKRKQVDTAILYSTYFMEYPYYYLLSKIFGFTLLIQYVEMYSVIPGRSALFTRVNDKLIDRYLCSFCDGVIAISDYLVLQVKKQSALRPVIKIPANSDFTLAALSTGTIQTPYLMYCGTIGHLEVIEFVLTLYERLKQNGAYNGNIRLVISGNHPENWAKLKSLLQLSLVKNNVLVESNISQLQLINAYQHADVLLIPLRNTDQDKARFPHKIGEYTSVARPLISTNIGELKTYFKDGVSAILAEEYSVDAYYHKLSGILTSKEILDKIGQAGRAVGLANFDYRAQGIQLNQFIDQLNHQFSRQYS